MFCSGLEGKRRRFQMTLFLLSKPIAFTEWRKIIPTPRRERESAIFSCWFVRSFRWWSSTWTLTRAWSYLADNCLPLPLIISRGDLFDYFSKVTRIKTRAGERVRVWRWLCQYIFNYLTQTLLIWWPWHSAPYSPSRRPYQEEETLKQRNFFFFFFFLCAVGFLFLFKKEKWNIGITSRICSIGLSRRSSASAVIVSDYYVTISMHNK